MFESDKGVFSLNKSTPDTELSTGFVEKVLSSTEDSTKVNYVLRKVGFSDRQLAPIMSVDKPSLTNMGSLKVEKPKESFNKAVLKKWRSVEQNVAAMLETFEGIIRVEDVSAQNLGYDLRTWNRDDTVSYYEVKSVNSLGDAVSITNNEYSTANEYGDRYYLAIAQQNANDISVCFVRDPIRALNLTKRVVRWEWVASSYEGTIIAGDLES